MMVRNLRLQLCSRLATFGRRFATFQSDSGSGSGKRREYPLPHAGGRPDETYTAEERPC